MTDRDASTLVRDALARLGPNGEHWIKGRARDEYGGMCISGAIAAEKMSDWDGDFDIDVYLVPINAVIAELFPDRPSFFAAFNDHPDTTWEDIRVVLEKTALRLEENEAQ